MLYETLRCYTSMTQTLNAYPKATSHQSHQAVAPTKTANAALAVKPTTSIF